MEAPEALILDLLRWIDDAPRTHAEVMDTWRTSCPRLPVWEDAVDGDLVRLEEQDGRLAVRVTPRGRAALATRRVPA